MADKESQKGLIVFQDQKIRRLWYNNEWFYFVTDIVAVFTDSRDEMAYWRKLKQREPQLVTICHGLKMPAKDGGGYKKFKGLSRVNQNLRDHMTDWELIFTMFGEKASADITRTRNAKGFGECKTSAKRGGQIAQNARKELEQETGEKVVSQENYMSLTKKKKKKLRGKGKNERRKSSS